MRLKNLLESTLDNMTLLKSIVDDIGMLLRSDDTIQPGDEIVLNYHPSDKTMRLAKSISPAAINAVEAFKFNGQIILTNNRRGYTFGALVQAGWKFYVYAFLPTIIREDGPINPLEHWKDISAALVHELRHLLQHFDHGDFSSKDQAAIHDENSDTTYSTSKTEIDAAFHQFLQDFDDITDDRVFTRTVVSALANYKNLTPKEEEHYRRKAAAYAHQRHGMPKDQDGLDARLSRFKKERQERREEERKRRIEPIIKLMDEFVRDSQGMLFKALGPRYGNASFPIEMFTAAIKSYLRKGEPNYPITMTYFALLWIYAKRRGVHLDLGYLIDNLAHDKDETLREGIHIVNTAPVFANMNQEHRAEIVEALRDILK